MDNLELYNKVRSVPANAKKPIEAGRQKGKTDINPMWRIKTLTEHFGPCGIGWKTEIKRVWLESGASEEVAAFVEIALYIKIEGAWSEAIPGLGGSLFIAKEKNGLYTDDDAYKKAYTDAISVACKALGIAADVYYEKDATKYDAQQSQEQPPAQQTQKPAQQTQKSEPTEPGVNTKTILRLIEGTSFTLDKANEWIKKRYGKAVKIDDLPPANFNDLYDNLEKAVKKEKAAADGSN